MPRPSLAVALLESRSYSWPTLASDSVAGHPKKRELAAHPTRPSNSSELLEAICRPHPTGRACTRSLMPPPRGVALLRQASRSLFELGCAPFPRPPKPGGYADSSADLASLLSGMGRTVLLPQDGLAGKDEALSFPDSQAGVRQALDAADSAGLETVTLWVNSVGSSTLVEQAIRDQGRAGVFVACPPKGRVEDKAATIAATAGLLPNGRTPSLLVWRSGADAARGVAAAGEYSPRGLWQVVGTHAAAQAVDAAGLCFPVVCKPVCGRGSEGVQVVSSAEELREYGEASWAARAEEEVAVDAVPGLEQLLRDRPDEALMADPALRGRIGKGSVSELGRMLAANVKATRSAGGKARLQWPRFGCGFVVEELLPGPEITVAVVPASMLGHVSVAAGTGRRLDWRALSRPDKGFVALTPIARTPSGDSTVMPYNGVEAVALNSLPFDQAEGPDRAEWELAVAAATRLCQDIGAVVGSPMPIRVDLRGTAESIRDDAFRFLPFDVNIKPNATYPGRPGRESATSLLAMAADASPQDGGFPALACSIVDTAPSLEDWSRVRSGL